MIARHPAYWRTRRRHARNAGADLQERSSDWGSRLRRGRRQVSNSGQDRPTGVSLRQQSFTGGIHLAIREVVGLGIRLCGVLLLTRLIGPVNYGLYAMGLAIVTVSAVLAQMGVEVYLIRHPEEPTSRTYNEAFSVLLLTSIAITAAVVGLTPLIVDIIGDQRLLTPLRVLALSIPANVLWAPAQASLERSFRFRRLAALELGGDLALYGVALPIALLGGGIWAPVSAHFVWQIFLLIGSYSLAGFCPRPVLPATTLAAIFRFGGAYTAGSLLYRARDVANAIIVGRYLGAASVGYVALASRLVDSVGFVVKATHRLALVAFAKVRLEPARVRRAVEEGMVLQVLVLAPLLVLFVLLSRQAIPRLFGSDWSPTIDILPFFAMHAVIAAVVNVQAAVLVVNGKNLTIAAYHALSVGILVFGGLVLIPITGIFGFGIALLASNVSFALIHRNLQRHVKFSYRKVAVASLFLAPGLFFPLLPHPFRLALLLPLLLIPFHTEFRAQLQEYAALFIREVLKRGRTSA